LELSTAISVLSKSKNTAILFLLAMLEKGTGLETNHI
jgi:hypothetical protein